MRKICINCRDYETCLNASGGTGQQIKDDDTCEDFEGNEEYIKENKAEMRSITKTFRRCWDCPMHKNEQMNGEFCYNERPYREILPTDTRPFPEWCVRLRYIRREERATNEALFGRR